MNIGTFKPVTVNEGNAPAKGFTPVGNFVLIQPRKLITYTKTESVPDMEKNKGKGPEEPYEFIDKKTKVNRSQQLAEVLSIGTLDPDKTPYKVGDVVVYPLNSVMDFELIKGCKLVYAHNILGIWVA
jgi:hypothetical protein